MLIVEKPKLSGYDHSFISAELELWQENKPVVKVLECRRWRAFNENSFTNDLVRSKLIVDLPSDVVSLANCYDQTLKSLVDRHFKIVIRSRPTSSWYDASCVNVKANMRRLEQFYSACHMSSLLDAWPNQLKYQRYYMQERYREYWANAVTDNLHNSKLLWSKVSGLLEAQPQSSTFKHTTDDFANHFRKKLITFEMRPETHHQLSSSTVRRQPGRFPADYFIRDLKDYNQFAQQTMFFGPCADVTHQAIVSGDFRHNCEHMQYVLYSRNATNDPEACHRSTKTEKTDTRH